MVYVLKSSCIFWPGGNECSEVVWLHMATLWHTWSKFLALGLCLRECYDWVEFVLDISMRYCDNTHTVGHGHQYHLSKFAWRFHTDHNFAAFQNMCGLSPDSILVNVKLS
jgi:hypothetical protein